MVENPSDKFILMFFIARDCYPPGGSLFGL